MAKMERANENKDNEMNNDLAELLNTAIKRIERLEESSNHETPPPKPAFHSSDVGSWME